MTQQAKLTVELIELSLNPTIRDMFTDVNAGLTIDDFVRKQHIQLNKEYTAGRPSGLVLTGSVVDLKEFINKFLSQDSGRGVYILSTSTAI